MRPLRIHPDIDQLRRQAKELVRAAKTERRQLTLAAAQRAIAADHGFRTWAELKTAVEVQRQDPPSFVLRYVRTPQELRQLWDAIARITEWPDSLPPVHWRVFHDFEAQRSRMLLVEHAERIVGGTIAMHLIAIEPWTRGIGLGRRLWQTLEGETVSAGLPLETHTTIEAREFFVKLGYRERGKSKLHMYKSVPSSRLRELRTSTWRTRVGDLRSGIVMAPDPITGKVEPLPW